MKKCLLVTITLIIQLAYGQAQNINNASLTDPATGAVATTSLHTPTPGNAAPRFASTTTINCADNKFWSVENNGLVIEWQLSGGVITLLDTLFTTSPGNGLAYCNSLDTASIPSTLYECNFGLASGISYFDGTSWVTVNTPSTYANAGGYGRFLYFMAPTIIGLFSTANNQLYRWDGTNMTNIMSLSGSRYFPLADLAVDTSGNIWTMIDESSVSDSLDVIDSAGNILKTYILNQPVNLVNSYGCFLMDSVFYIGLGPTNSVYPSSLLPVTLTPTRGIVGNPISFASSNFIDLASCYPQKLSVVLPAANFSSSKTSICAYDCIKFTDMSTNATSWQWSFPGAADSTSTAQNPQNICYFSPGIYNASLIASNAAGSDTVTFSNYINVKQAPPTPVITQHYDTLYCSTDTSYSSYQWYSDSTLITGATDTFLVITHGGNYNIQVSNTNNCKVAVGINIVLGLQNYSNDNTLSLSPNPATDQLVISGNWKETGNMWLTIFNILGEIIYAEPVNHKQETIDCKLFPAGIYFIQVESENGRWVAKFVKE